MTIQEIEEHNKAVEKERRAYHNKRCGESENYKRVFDNITKMYDILAQQNAKVRKAVSETRRIVEEQNLTDKDGMPLIPNSDFKPDTNNILENFGFMMIAWLFGLQPDFLLTLDLQHFEEDKPYYEEYFKAEAEFNKRVILIETPDR